MTKAKYFEGDKCPRCGSTQRYRSSSRCVRCARMSAAGMTASEIRGVMAAADAPDMALGNDPQLELRRIMLADVAYLRRMQFGVLDEPDEEEDECCAVCGGLRPPNRSKLRTCSPECAKVWASNSGVRPRNRGKDHPASGTHG